MADCKLTFLGAYGYYEGREVNGEPIDLFDFFQVPEGLEKDIIINDIMYRAGEFELLYLNPEYTRFSLGVFSQKWASTWQKWYDALMEEYNPLENYNRHEEYIDKHTGSQSNSSRGSDTVNNTGSQTNSESIQATGETILEERGSKITNISNSETESVDNNDTSETLNSIYAYNENDDNTDPAPNNKSFTEETKNDSRISQGAGSTTEKPELDTTSTRNLLDTKSGLRVDNLSEEKTSSEDNFRVDNLQTEHTAHLYGNIGVTTSQQMLKEELEIRKNNIYNMIADMVIQEFCIMIY